MAQQDNWFSFIYLFVCLFIWFVSLHYLFGIVHAITNKGSSEHVSHSCFYFVVVTNKRQSKTDIVFTNLMRWKKITETKMLLDFLQFQVVLTFMSVHDYSEERYWAIHLYFHAILFIILKKVLSSFLVHLWNPRKFHFTVWPFKWKLFNNIYMLILVSQHYFFQNEFQLFFFTFELDYMYAEVNEQLHCVC